MPKPEFGKKVICNNCGVKFYDLNRKPATCPSCGTEYTEPSNETITTKAKQVFVDDVDTVEVAESFGTVSHAAKNKANNIITKYLV